MLVMRVYLEKSLAHAKVTVTMNMLQRYCAKSLAFNDVKSSVENIVRKFKSNMPKDPLKIKLETVIMKSKLADAIRKHRESNIELQNAKSSLTLIVRKGTFVREFFNEIVARETTLVWNMEKSRTVKKEDWSQIKQVKARNVNPQIVQGVLVGDEVLENEFADDTIAGDDDASESALKSLSSNEDAENKVTSESEVSEAKNRISADVTIALDDENRKKAHKGEGTENFVLYDNVIASEDKKTHSKHAS